MKTPEECLSDATCETVDELEKCREVPIVRPSEAVEAIEAYHAQFEGECKWESKPFEQTKISCGAKIVSGVINYCPYCGRKIERV